MENVAGISSSLCLAENLIIQTYGNMKHGTKTFPPFLLWKIIMVSDILTQVALIIIV